MHQETNKQQLCKCTMVNTSAIWQQTAYTTDHHLWWEPHNKRTALAVLKFNQKYWRTFWRKSGEWDIRRRKKKKKKKEKKERATHQKTEFESILNKYACTMHLIYIYTIIHIEIYPTKVHDYFSYGTVNNNIYHGCFWFLILICYMMNLYKNWAHTQTSMH